MFLWLLSCYHGRTEGLQHRLPGLPTSRTIRPFKKKFPDSWSIFLLIIASSSRLTALGEVFFLQSHCADRLFTTELTLLCRRERLLPGGSSDVPLQGSTSRSHLAAEAGLCTERAHPGCRALWLLQLKSRIQILSVLLISHVLLSQWRNSLNLGLLIYKMGIIT